MAPQPASKSAVWNYRPECERLEDRLAPASLRSFSGLYEGFGTGTGTVLLTGESGTLNQDVQFRVNNQGGVKVIEPISSVGALQKDAITLKANGTARIKFKLKVNQDGVSATIQVQGTAGKLPDGDVAAQGRLKSLTPGLTISDSFWRVERFKSSAFFTAAQTIPDQGTISTSIVIADSVGVINDIDVRVDISHTFNADLDVTLTHVPSGKSVTLFADAGGGDNGFKIGLNDEAPFSITTADHPDGLRIRGVFKPAVLLSFFDGVDASGEWRLSVTDDAGGDTGTLNGWSLFFS